MVAELIPERDWRGPGCDERCRPIKALIPGVFGRSELMLHDPAAHEEYGRWASVGADRSGGVVMTGLLMVDFRTLAVAVDGISPHITPTERRILLALARRVGTTMPVADILAESFDDGEDRGDRALLLVNQHRLRVNVNRLRSRLGRARTLIRTLPGFGYRLEMIPVGETLPPQAGVVRSLEPRWAVRWDHCRLCGSTERRHEAHGYCARCRAKVRGGRA